MALVAGVDGCSRGWVLAQRDTDSVLLELRVVESFDQILDHPLRPEATGVDMPIGLLDAGRPGGRPCDLQARKLLSTRSSCVFSPVGVREVAARSHPNRRPPKPEELREAQAPRSRGSSRGPGG